MEEFKNEKIFKNYRYSFFSIIAVAVLANSQLFGSTIVHAVTDDDSVIDSSVVDSSIDSSDSSHSGQEEIELETELPENKELLQQSENLKQEISTESLDLQRSAPTFSVMAVNPGNYSPDNWSSGYRIKTVDSADKRAELFNDFSYWMVRKFEIEIDTRYANDMNIIKLVNDATSTISSNYSFLNARINSTNTGQGNLQSQVNSLDSWLNARIDSTNTGQGKLQSQVNNLDSWLNARIDSTNTGQGKLQSQVDSLDSWLNKRIDSTNTYTSFLNDRIDSSNTSIGTLDSRVGQNYDWVNKRIDSTNTYTSFLNDRIDSTNLSIGKLDSRVGTTESNISALSATVNGIDLWGPIRDFFGVNDFSNNHGGSDGAFTKLMKTHNQNILISIDSLKSNLASIVSSTAFMDARLKDSNLKLDLINSRLLDLQTIDARLKDSNLKFDLSNSTLKGLKNYDDSSFKQFFRALTYSSDYSSGIISSDGEFVKTVKGQFTRLISELNKKTTDQIGKIDLLKTELTNVGNKIKDYSSLLTTLNLSTLANATAINNFSTENAENLTFINSTLKGLKNYDDSSFKQFFRTLTYSSDYSSGIISSDGEFVKTVKGQFTRLIAELNRQLTLSFTATTNNIESFKTYLRQEFALLNDWASLQVDWSTMINENILVAIAALDKIVGKPNGDVIVNVPPDNIEIPVFDYDRLKEILDELSFGNVVNEAGTNLWDVLKELIETLGGVIEAVVGIVPDLIDKLIGLVIPENRNIFSEKMSQFTGKFENKFSSITSVTTEFKNVYSQPKNINSIQINIFDQNLKLIPDMFAENFNWLRSMLSAFMYLSTLVTCYKRIVGSGDVIE